MTETRVPLTDCPFPFVRVCRDAADVCLYLSDANGDGVSGFCVPTGDAPALAAAVAGESPQDAGGDAAELAETRKMFAGLVPVAQALAHVITSPGVKNGQILGAAGILRDAANNAAAWLEEHPARTERGSKQ